MEPVATLSSKGQLVLPKSVRDRHGWKAGDRFQVVETAGAVLLRALQEPASGPTASVVFAEIAALVAAASPAAISDAEAQAAAATALAEADAFTRSH